MTKSLAVELSSLALLADATGEEVGSVTAAMRPGRAAAGETLGRQGDPGASFWLLLSGRVEITMASRSGRGQHHLAFAGPGSIIGELALLRRQPRSATVTALEDCTFAVGGPEALDRLLLIGAARSRLRLLASIRLAEDLVPVHASLRDGTPVLLRPLLAEDREALRDGLHSLSHESLRRRFFSEAQPSEALIDYLVHIDYVDHFAWAVLDAKGRFGMATARYVRIAGSDTAEAAFTAADAFQGRGLGTLLLGCLGATALEAGISKLVAYVMEDNMAMRTVLAKAGGKSAYDEPGVLEVSVLPDRAAALLDPEVRAAIASSVHDIVTAATLALAERPGVGSLPRQPAGPPSAGA